MSMHAAVVRSFGHPPRYESYDTPEPQGPDETLVRVLAAGLHPRVRTGASGQHYTSTGTLPMIPGVDGVGRLADGRLIYFSSPDDAWGSMAQQAVVDRRRTIPLPENADVARVAAAMNPAMSSWVALHRRVPLQLGNGQGAVSPRGYLAELPSLVDEIDAGTIRVEVRPVPLSDVASAWNAPEAPGVRTVLLPGR